MQAASCPPSKKILLVELGALSFCVHPALLHLTQFCGLSFLTLSCGLSVAFFRGSPTSSAIFVYLPVMWSLLKMAFHSVLPRSSSLGKLGSPVGPTLPHSGRPTLYAQLPPPMSSRPKSPPTIWSPPTECPRRALSSTCSKQEGLLPTVSPPPQNSLFHFFSSKSRGACPN